MGFGKYERVKKPEDMALFDALIHAVIEKGNDRLFYGDDDEIWTDNDVVYNAILTLFDTLGLGENIVTGYFDPKEDKEDGVFDKFTGCYYIRLE